jgi:hypothetical protein
VILWSTCNEVLHGDTLFVIHKCRYLGFVARKADDFGDHPFRLYGIDVQRSILVMNEYSSAGRVNTRRIRVTDLRFMNHRPPPTTIFDRVALTDFVFCQFVELVNLKHFLHWPLLLAVLGLFAAWCAVRFTRSHRDHAVAGIVP